MTFYLPTSSKVKITIRGIHLDLAFRLDWKETQPRIPIYGYNDHEYTKTIAGRRIIQGFLVMNYIAPHYLTSIHTKEELDRRHKETERQKIELEEILPPTLTAAERKARAEMIASKLFAQADAQAKSLGGFPSGKERYLKRVARGIRDGDVKTYEDVVAWGEGKSYSLNLKQQLIDMFIKGREKTQTDPFLLTPFEMGRPFPMEIYHIEPEYAPWYIVLEDVEITDISQTMSAAGADGSSDPLYETYEFIAKRRKIKRTRHSTQSR